MSERKHKQSRKMWVPKIRRISSRAIERAKASQIYDPNIALPIEEFVQQRQCMRMTSSGAYKTNEYVISDNSECLDDIIRMFIDLASNKKTTVLKFTNTHVYTYSVRPNSLKIQVTCPDDYGFFSTGKNIYYRNGSFFDGGKTEEYEDDYKYPKKLTRLSLNQLKKLLYKSQITSFTFNTIKKKKVPIRNITMGPNFSGTGKAIIYIPGRKPIITITYTGREFTTRLYPSL